MNDETKQFIAELTVFLKQESLKAQTIKKADILDSFFSRGSISAIHSVEKYILDFYKRKIAE